MPLSVCAVYTVTDGQQLRPIGNISFGANEQCANGRALISAIDDERFMFVYNCADDQGQSYMKVLRIGRGADAQQQKDDRKVNSNECEWPILVAPGHVSARCGRVVVCRPTGRVHARHAHIHSAQFMAVRLSPTGQVSMDADTGALVSRGRQ